MTKKIMLVPVFLALGALPLSAFAAANISLVGGGVSFSIGQSYSEPGYSAFSTADGNITSQVAVTNHVNSSTAGTYRVNYTVTDSEDSTADASREVTVTGGGVTDPCNWNHSCPCPMSADIVAGDYKAWKACAVANYPKTTDGSTLVCRLRPLTPIELAAHSGVKCADDQAGMLNMLISPTGLESYLWK